LKISVIIATRNRADALEKISLPSLAKQDFKDFEVIIWDASDDNKSKIVVENFIQSHPDMIVRYFKAPRVGLPSQRNDAVKVALGDIIFFIDDDSKVSSDGIRAIYDAFEENKDIVGASLPSSQEQYLVDKNNEPKNLEYVVLRTFSKLLLFDDVIRKKVKIHFLKIFRIDYKESPYVKNLPGRNMAFKKEVFLDHHFEEKLEKFGGYAAYEDTQFTRRLYEEKKKLFITKKGDLLHLPAKGGRPENKNFIAISIYNRFIVWKTAIYPFKKPSILSFTIKISGRIVLLYFIYLLHPKKKKYIKEGLKIGIKEILNFRYTNIEKRKE